MNSTNLRQHEAEDLAQHIVAHPVTCPSWCQLMEHELTLSECLEDCGYTHSGEYPVPGSDHLVVNVVDIQSIAYDYKPKPAIHLESVGSWGREELLNSLWPKDARALAAALLRAADLMEGKQPSH